MRTGLILLCLLAFAPLPGCDNVDLIAEIGSVVPFSQDEDTNTVTPAPPETRPDGFAGYLYDEYNNLVQYESTQPYRHRDNRATFAKQAKALSRGKMVEPLNPEKYDLPEDELENFKYTRNVLMNALEKERPEFQQPLMAFAQTRYDCWLMHREDYPQLHALLACQDHFYEAMMILEPASLRQKKGAIYFPTNSISISDKGKSTIRKLARQYQEDLNWQVILKGYSDPEGNKTQNMTLSLRRAVAVKNLLGQSGVDLDRIIIYAEGEIQKEDLEPGVSASAQSRRVDIYFDPMVSTSSKEDDTPQHGVMPGWSHSDQDY